MMQEVVDDLLHYVKRHSRIDGTIEDDYLKDEIEIAIADAADSGVPVSMRTDPRYKKLIAMYVTHWYENRAQIDDSAHANLKIVPYGINSLILKMRVVVDDE